MTKPAGGQWARLNKPTTSLSRASLPGRGAFEALYRKRNALVRVCPGMVRNHATAEELVQETWIAVLKNIGGFEGRSSLAGWIYTTLNNKARSRLKRDGRSVSFDESGEDN